MTDQEKLKSALTKLRPKEVAAIIADELLTWEAAEVAGEILRLLPSEAVDSSE